MNATLGDKIGSLPPELAAEVTEQLNRDAMLPVELLDSAFYRFLDRVTLQTRWGAAGGVIFFVTIWRGSFNGHFEWSIDEPDSDAPDDPDFRTSIGESWPHVFESAVGAYQHAVASLQASLNDPADDEDTDVSL